MNLAFVIVPEEILISSTDPDSYRVRADAGRLLKWCSERGSLFLNTELPAKTSSPELILDVESVIWKAAYSGPYVVWDEQTRIRNEGIRKTKESAHFGQSVPVEVALTVDRVTGYSKLVEKGYTVVHIGTDLSEVEGRQLQSYHGHFVKATGFPNVKTHGLRWAPDGTYEIVAHGEGRAYGPFELTDVEKSRASSMARFLERNSSALVERHIDDLPYPSLMEEIPMEVATTLMGQSSSGSIQKSDGLDFTQGGIDQWVAHHASKKPQD